MNKYKFYLVVFFCMMTNTLSAYTYDFSALNDDGVRIYYDISSKVDKTVRVTNQGGDHRYYSGSIVIPQTVSYNGSVYTVITIGSYAFENSTGLTSIDIPNSVTTIEEDAFSGCTSLTNIKIPNSVTTIEEDAFYGCI